MEFKPDGWLAALYLAYILVPIALLLGIAYWFFNRIKKKRNGKGFSDFTNIIIAIGIVFVIVYFWIKSQG